MSNTISERIEKLRALMAEKRYDAVIVPTGDYHMSEYTGDYFKCRVFITGFTGSAGTAVIFREAQQTPHTDKIPETNRPVSGLWTDSRYFIQAKSQLKGTGLSLFKTGEPGTPSITEHLACYLGEGARVACDGRVISFDTFAQWYDFLEEYGIELDEQADLIGELWDITGKQAATDISEKANNGLIPRPPMPKSHAYEYDVRYAGTSRAGKLELLSRKIADKGAGAHLLTSLDDIAWLLNIRASDVHCNPVLLAYFLAEKDPDGWSYRLFADPDSIGTDLMQALLQDGVVLEPYDSIGTAMTNLSSRDLLLSASETNSYLYGLIPPSVYIIEDSNPTLMMKAVKNSVECKGARTAHLKDGIALTKFMYWLKTNAADSNIQITEISAAEKLYELRSGQENFMGNSFDPIIAYADHAAIVHYQATEETNVPLEPKGLVLCDTGGHYLEGTTDVTRTIALGPLTSEELRMSTAVLQGHIALASAVFPYGLNGANLDYLAHAPLWKLGKDYGHGTGHGVGHFLNVHEGPNYIHWTRNGNTGTTPPFEPGMITSCEPGYYEDGKFGIRHESLLLCVPYAVSHETHTDEQSSEVSCNDANENSSSDLLCFEELTLVPFDLDTVDISVLNKQEKEFLNAYHKKIYAVISPFLTQDERDWLRQVCRPV